MAAFLHLPTARGAVGAANIIAALKRNIAATLSRQKAASIPTPPPAPRGAAA